LVTIRTQIEIKAPIELCFDMARNIELHTKTVWKHTKDRAIAGRTIGMIEAGEQVNFEATHFLIRQRLKSKIIEFNKPYKFVDQMVSGAFRTLNHKHEFMTVHNHTVMKDELTFEAPYGLAGKAAEMLILSRYMRNFLNYRNSQLKLVVEECHAQSLPKSMRNPTKSL
jgi:ligand-binding SRPBCC domain-containing protein